MWTRWTVWLPGAILVGALSVGLIIWVGIVTSVVSESRDASIDGAPFGRDFAAFQLAGQRAMSGDAQDLYTFEAEAISESRGPARFVNPPFYAFAMTPFSGIDFLPGYLIWTALGVVALAIALKLLDIRYPVAWFFGTLLTMAGLLNTFYGQNTLFTFFLFGVAYASMRARRELIGGALIGFSAYKPQLIGGFAVWFVSGFRTMRKAMGGAVLALGLLVGGSLLVIPEAWPRFADALLTSGDDLAIAEVQLSLGHAVTLLLPGSAVLALGFYSVALVVVIAGQVWFLRRVEGDLALEFASAVAISVLLAPRGLTYDWALLAIPLSLVWTSRPDRWNTWLWLTSGLVLAVLVSVYAAKWQMAEFGRAVQIAPVMLAIVLGIAGWVLAADRPGTLTETGPAATPPVKST